MTTFLLVRHKVKDYAKWRPIFEAHGVARKKSGSKGGRVFRNSADPNETVVLIEFEDLERLRQFAGSADLHDTMVRAGVSDKPDVYFLDEAGTVPQ